MFTLYFGIRGRSRNMTLLYLCTLFFCIAGIHMGVVGSNMCDDGWVYNSNTATCLKTISGVHFRDFVSGRKNPCLDTTGGEFGNISGHVVEFTETIEPFLRNYLQFMKLPEAGVELSYRWLERSVFIYYENPLCRRGGNLRTYFVPAKPVPFQARFSNDPPIICQVTAGPFEPPVCPRDVKLVSVSDRNATLSWSPGQLGRGVVVNITVQICDGVPLSCEYSSFHIFTSFQDVSLFQLMNYTVSGLQPNKRYKLVLQIQKDKFETKDCNVTLALQTNESTLALQTNECTNEGQVSAAAVIGLSVILSISLCACSVLAILLCRHYQQDKKDKNSDIDKIVPKVMKPTSSNQEVKLQVHKDPETNSAMYLNVQAAPHEYEQTIDNQDNHIYEM